MLHQYSFKNYLSFMDETTVSLIASQDDAFIAEDFNGTKLSLATAVIGANASGKTSLLKPIALLEWLICQSFQAPIDSKIPVERHFFSESKSSEFEFIFSFKSNLYKYEFEIVDGFFAKEILSKKGKKRFEYVIKRNFISGANKLKVTSKVKNLEKNVTLVSRNNASCLAIFIQFGFEEFQGIGKFFQTSKLYLESKTELDYRITNMAVLRLFDIAEDVAKNNDLLLEIKKIILSLDLGISDIVLKKIKGNDPQGKEREFPVFVAQHSKEDGEVVDRYFIHESSGTQTLLNIFAKVYPVLKDGGVFAIDEMESDLHPMMVKHLLNLFSNSEINLHKAQIIFTTHSIEVINSIEKSQIYLVEKNGCLSDIWRLDDVEGVRRDDNYYAKYMAGAYGAIPRL